MKNNLLYLLLLGIAIGGVGCGPKKNKENKKGRISKSKDIGSIKADENVEELDLMDEMDDNFFTDNSTQKIAGKGDDFAWVDIEDKNNPEEILFDFDRDEIRQDQQKKVSKARTWAKNVSKKGGNIVVEGHADAIGARDYNLALSERRAKTVAHELIYEGASKDKIKLVGRGQEMQKVIAPLTPEAQQPNRRVALYEVK